MNPRPALNVPRITESFIDVVVEKVGGRRLSAEEIEKCAGENADYILPLGVAELKIFEEEGLEKESRQKKILSELRKHFILPKEVDLDIKRLMPEARQLVKELLREPLSKSTTKAASQIKNTKKALELPLHSGILIAVNNGYSSLESDEFENLVLSCLNRDTSQIDFAICITVTYHQGGFDSYVFCTTHAISKKSGLAVPYSEAFVSEVDSFFSQRMTDMMRSMMISQFSEDEHLPPVKNIVFTRDGIQFIRPAPAVPDSRFKNGG